MRRLRTASLIHYGIRNVGKHAGHPFLRGIAVQVQVQVQVLAELRS